VTSAGAPLWTPSPGAPTARLAAFRRRAGSVRDYESLHAWSVEQPEEFWR
jgi:acetoacetyl-CoA synthetase